MTLEIPELALVVLIGPSGAGKSTFAARHFLPTEVVSSDACRALVSDDENNQAATGDAFDLVHYIARKRLGRGRLTVIDATNVRADDRKHMIDIAREQHVLPVAIVFDLPESVCHERNASRPDRTFGPQVVRRQRRQMRQGLRGLKREGFRYIHTLRSPEEVAAVEIERTRLWTDRRDLGGPFDIIGDIHGCFDELVALLKELDYRVERQESGYIQVEPPEGRMAVFLGDYGDRGPHAPDVYRLVMGMVADGTALALPGNHDDKLARYLAGRRVTINQGLDKTIEQLDAQPAALKQDIREFIQGLVSHYVLDGGRLVVAHGGMPAHLQGRSSRTVRDTALYGVTTGRMDDYGLPERVDWASDYRGEAMVVYGHTAIAEPVWRNGTINIDTGCVFGGKLTALRYPERETVSVPAERAYAEPGRPFLPDDGASDERPDDLLDVGDVLGRRVIQTRLVGRVTIADANAAAALEVMARFAAHPGWLVYLPPTMSPPETSAQPGLLEHPAEAFAYYRQRGIEEVICQAKHMGSRAIVIACRDADVARERFGAHSGEPGIIYTRTGRSFFDDTELERSFLGRVRAALERAGFWEELETEWVVLDCELMPWSVKAQGLLRSQYAAIGSAARASLDAAIESLEHAGKRALEVGDLLERQRERRDAAGRYVAAYRNYCWPVEDLTDLKLAPFHIMASEGGVHTDRDHAWHMRTIAAICEHDPELLLPTDHRRVNLLNPESVDAATAWWFEMTATGGEGMVVKPLEFVARGERRPLQPAIKVRGREYLRIIYGPEYDRPEHLARLRKRSTGRKRGLAMSEFALGIEALERFVRQEPLYRVHECVFGVLALESEPVDPRL